MGLRVRVRGAPRGPPGSDEAPRQRGTDPFLFALSADGLRRAALTLDTLTPCLPAGLLSRLVLSAECSTISARVMGTDVTYKLGSPGRHLATNSLAVLAAAKLAGADLAVAALALAEMRAVSGRGERTQRRLNGGSFTLLDESYNANPVSVRAALAVLASRGRPGQGRRIAVLGDMLELGAEGPALHAGLARPLQDAGTDLVFCSGPLMENLWKALPAHMRGAYAATSADLEPLLMRALKADDIVMVKGSRGSRMAPLVENLKARFPLVAPEDLHQGAA